MKLTLKQIKALKIGVLIYEANDYESQVRTIKVIEIHKIQRENSKTTEIIGLTQGPCRVHIPLHRAHFPLFKTQQEAKNALDPKMRDQIKRNLTAAQTRKKDLLKALQDAETRIEKLKKAFAKLKE